MFSSLIATAFIALSASALPSNPFANYAKIGHACAIGSEDYSNVPEQLTCLPGLTCIDNYGLTAKKGGHGHCVDEAAPKNHNEEDDHTHFHGIGA